MNFFKSLMWGACNVRGCMPLAQSSMREWHAPRASNFPEVHCTEKIQLLLFWYYLSIHSYSLIHYLIYMCWFVLVFAHLYVVIVKIVFERVFGLCMFRKFYMFFNYFAGYEIFCRYHLILRILYKMWVII